MCPEKFLAMYVFLVSGIIFGYLLKTGETTLSLATNEAVVSRLL